MEIMEPKEADIRLHTQEVRGSSPRAATTLSIRYMSSGGSFLCADSQQWRPSLIQDARFSHHAEARSLDPIWLGANR